jgi:antitoxin HicB
MTHNFSVILEPQSGGGFTVLVSSLPEAVTGGDTEQEALANAEETIRAVLEYRRAHGLPIPSDAPPEIRRVTVAA